MEHSGKVKLLVQIAAFEQAGIDRVAAHSHPPVEGVKYLVSLQAPNGQVSIPKELSNREDFDIIILDVMMPRLDGFSACKEIRKFKQTPVLMLSARGEDYDKLFGFEIGADDYVVKPFSRKRCLPA